MIIEVFFNTDGYLGAWGTRNGLTPEEITAEKIAQAKENETGLAFEIPDHDIALFHNAIECRGGVEILTSDAEVYDVAFGNMKLKFNDTQNEIDLEKTREAHKLNKNKNAIEKAIFDF